MSLLEVVFYFSRSDAQNLALNMSLVSLENSLRAFNLLKPFKCKFSMLSSHKFVLP